jgi:tetratricopeptide (TPR) repeat protein
MPSQERDTLLICYSPPDRAYVEELQAHLAPKLGGEHLAFWEAPQISPPPDVFRGRIEAALARAAVALLLVSADFLASHAVNEVLLPFLLAPSTRAGAQILTVIASPCDFQQTPLAAFQTANDPSHPLSQMTAGERASLWEWLAREIRRLLPSSPPQPIPVFRGSAPGSAPQPVEQAPPGASPQFEVDEPGNAWQDAAAEAYSMAPPQVYGSGPFAYPPPSQVEAPGGSTWRGVQFPTAEEAERSPASPVRHLDFPGIPPETSAPGAGPPHFAAFSPREVTAETWNTLLAYVHIASALEQVRADARKFQPELGERPREAASVASQSVARGTEITFVPGGQGITFNPPRASFTWLEDWQRANFRFLVSKALAGSAAIGEITVYAGPLIIATLTFGVLVEERPIPQPERAPANEVSSSVYQRIFTSYSHKDTPVVLACRNTYKGLGLEVLIDLDTLRSGQVWNEELMRMIDRADVFQLFWSPRAAQSEYVRQEWQHALRRNLGVGFIRPVYWELPQVAPPQELSHLHFMYMPLPRIDVPMSAYDQAIQTDPINAIAYHTKGDALSEQQHYQEALPYYDRAAQLDPGYAPTWSNKGNALYMLGRYDEAVAALDRAIQAQPENALAYLRKVAVLAKLQRYEEALAACDQVIRLQPNDASSYNNKGTTLMMLGRFEEAAAAYQQALQLHSAYGVAYRNLGIALERLGRRAEAAQAYQRARELGAR